jgi:hypothetical protein
MSLVLVTMTFLGLYAGMHLDKEFGTAPNFTFIGLIAGIALGFKGFIEEVVSERKRNIIPYRSIFFLPLLMLENNMSINKMAAHMPCDEVRCIDISIKHPLLLFLSAFVC